MTTKHKCSGQTLLWSEDGVPRGKHVCNECGKQTPLTEAAVTKIVEQGWASAEPPKREPPRLRLVT